VNRTIQYWYHKAEVSNELILDEDPEEYNEKKVLADQLTQKFEKKQNFFKEVNKRKERQRQELKQEDAKRVKRTDNL
jgi:hypothetical protein